MVEWQVDTVDKGTYFFLRCNLLLELLTLWNGECLECCSTCMLWVRLNTKEEHRTSFHQVILKSWIHFYSYKHYFSWKNSFAIILALRFPRININEMCLIRSHIPVFNFSESQITIVNLYFDRGEILPFLSILMKMIIL